MVISENNKAAFFEVQLTHPKIEINQQLLEEKPLIQIDLLFLVMDARKIYKFSTKTQNKNKEKHVSYFFTTQTRKRKDQIIKYLEKFIEKENRIVSYRVIPILKKEFYPKIENRLKNEKTKLLYNPRKELVYNGEDLQILDNKKNWHPWQLELYEKIFYQRGEIRRASS